MNRYFGEPWDAPFVADAQPIDTPVGRTCLVCEESIEPGDQGVMMPLFYAGPDGGPVARLEAEHRGCMLLGVVGHMAGTCFCHEGLGSIRERGQATVAWVEANRL